MGSSDPKEIHKEIGGDTTTFTYDGNGNKVTETDSEGNVTRFTYDENNNVLTETRTRQIDGDAVEETTTYVYGALE